MKFRFDSAITSVDWKIKTGLKRVESARFQPMTQISCLIKHVILLANWSPIKIHFNQEHFVEF